jgi:hypothetical protein
MADRVSEHLISRRTVVKERRPHRQDLVVRCGEIVDLKVEV